MAPMLLGIGLFGGFLTNHEISGLEWRRREPLLVLATVCLLGTPRRDIAAGGMKTSLVAPGDHGLGLGRRDQLAQWCAFAAFLTPFSRRAHLSQSAQKGTVGR